MKKLYLALLMTAAIAIPARAANFDRILTQIDGKPFTEPKAKPDDPDVPEKVPTTLRKVVVNALLAEYPDERNPQTGVSTLSGEQKMARFLLAMKIQKSGSEDLVLTADEIVLVKTLVAKGFPIVIMGQVNQLLDRPAASK